MDIGAWLRSLGLEQYEATFRDNAIDAEVLPELSEADLEQVGVLLGHRKRLLKAIAAWRDGAASRSADPEPQAGPLVREPVSSSADRRQLTVMFCDLVGSTALSARLDPEDLREVIRAYQDTCASAIARFEGHVAKFMGDGVLAYFGFPRAHEDDAERAVRAALEVVAAVSQLRAPDDTALAARVGVATGVVIVGDLVGSGTAQEQAVVGETPNLAARLQALAKPNSVVISHQTRGLVGGLFEVANLGRRQLKGLASPVDAWQVIGVSAAEGRFDARRGIGLTPLVGRIEELGLLLRRWEHAKAGEGQVVLLSGEAGIGKSRIIQTLREQLAAQPHTRLIYYCSALHVNSSLFPVLAQLERAAGLARDEPPERQLDKLEELLGRAVADVRGVAPLVAALLSIPDRGRYPPLNMSPQRQKEKTLEALLAQLDGFAARAPVLMVFEDVHWIDPTSRELLDLTVERVQSLRAMLVITHRPEFVSPWIGQAHVTLLSLNRLGRRQGTAMIEQLTGGKILPAPVLEQIAAKSDGVPLFVEELTKAVLESDLLRDEGDRYALTGPLPEFAVPATLRDSLMARLDRTALIKEVAQIGAALGREFSYELLSEVAPLDENTLREGLEQLCSCELVFRRGAPPDATYVFKHALVQDAAYSSLLKSKRQQLHSRIAQVIEERFPETAQSQPELLARHYSQACLIGPAVDCWLKAGQLALTRSATAEAIAQLSEGLELLSDLPEGLERSERELDLQVTLGGALIAANGFAAPETGRAWARARELCQQLQLPQSPRLAKAMYGQYVFYHVRAEFGASRGVAEEMLRLAEGQDDPVYRLMGHRTLGNVLVVLGELVEAREHLERALALYDSAQHRSLAMHYTFDPRIASLSYLSLALVALGYPDQALLRSREAVAYANELCHFNSVAQALFFGCVAHQLLGNRRAVHEQAHAVISLSNEQGFPYWLAAARVLQGWAVASEGHSDEGVAEMRAGLTAYVATGARVLVPYFGALVADACGPGDTAATELEQALAVAARTGEGWFEPELHRLTGELVCVRRKNQAEAEACFGRSIALARQRAMRLWELRAATSLARLWRQNDRQAEAHDLLTPLCGWFTEGFDTPDLQRAKALREGLRE